jgi:hypothetical protein
MPSSTKELFAEFVVISNSPLLRDQKTRLAQAQAHQRTHCAPEAAHVDVVGPCVVRVERVEVVLHDEAQIPDTWHALPGGVAPRDRGADAEEGDGVREEVRDAAVHVLLAHPGLLDGAGEHGRAEALGARGGEAEAGRDVGLEAGRAAGHRGRAHERVTAGLAVDTRAEGRARAGGQVGVGAHARVDGDAAGEARVQDGALAVDDAHVHDAARGRERVVALGAGRRGDGAIGGAEGVAAFLLDGAVALLVDEEERPGGLEGRVTRGARRGRDRDGLGGGVGGGGGGRRRWHLVESGQGATGSGCGGCTLRSDDLKPEVY